MVSYEDIRMEVRTRSANTFEKTARYYLSLMHCELRCANDLDAMGRDGDAMLSRENAYWLGLEATECFNQALQVRSQKA